MKQAKRLFKLLSLIFLLSSPVYSQPSTITNLTNDTSPATTDEYIVQKSGETRAKKQSAAIIKRIFSSTTLPATCSIGDTFWDTDADTDGSLFICRANDIWKDVDDDGAAGGASNSFETINAPTGTDPVADSSTDILNLTCAGGLTCTGTAASDTLDLTISSAPALAANGANCSAGNYPLGIDAAGAAETCTPDDDTPDNDGEVPNIITIDGGTIGTNTITGINKTSGLLNEGGQASVGATPHFFGIADGSVASPQGDPQPTVVFQRTDSGSTTAIPFQFTFTKVSGNGFHYPLHVWAENNSNTLSDLVAVTGSAYQNPTTIVSNVIATPSASGGTLATNTYSYYVSAIIAGTEIIASSHVDAVVTGPTGSVALTWDALGGATSYLVYRYIPSAPATSPVKFSTLTNSFTDVGDAGTAGVGVSQTLWSFWGRCEKVSDSGRCANEFDTINSSGRDAGSRPDRVGSMIGLQLVSAGNADNSIGYHITGDATSQYHIAMLVDQYGFDQIGIDFNNSDDTKPAIRLANDQDISARNAADTADIEALKVGTGNLVHLGSSAVTVDGPNQRLGIVTTSPDEHFEIESSENASVVSLTENPNTGTSAIAINRVLANTAMLSMQAHADARTTSRFGVTIGGYAELLQTTGSGLLIGTSTSVPMILGTASTAALTINADGTINIPNKTALAGLLQLGSLTIGSASCIAVTSDRTYGDLDCDNIKDVGEEYLDQSAGSAGALPRVKVTHSANQSITSQTSPSTVLAWDTESVDEGTFHDTVTNNSRLDIPSGEGGTYLIDVSLQWRGGNGTRAAQVIKNGTTIIKECDLDSPAAGATVIVYPCSGVFDLLDTDYIEIQVWHDHGSALQIDTGGQSYAYLVKMR